MPWRIWGDPAAILPGWRRWWKSYWLRLPPSWETALKTADLSEQDVLVGTLRNRRQFKVCLENKFYHLPKKYLKDTAFPPKWVAIYQSKQLFSARSGIFYYGSVKKAGYVLRSEIEELPKNSCEVYCRLEVAEWQELKRPILPKEIGIMPLIMTNIFLLLHSEELPELTLRSAAEFAFYRRVRRLNLLCRSPIYADGAGFSWGEYRLVVGRGFIQLQYGRRVLGEQSLALYEQTPGAVCRYFWGKMTRCEV